MRVIAFMLVGLAALSLSASPSVATTRTTHATAKAPTAYQLRKYIQGRTITHNKVSVTVTGWTKVVQHKHRPYWVPKLRVQDHRACRPRCPEYNANFSWSSLNPFHWAWSKIWSKMWNGLFVACAKGIKNGVLGGAAATMSSTMVMRGAVVEATPEGAALVAIGGCLVGIEGS